MWIAPEPSDPSGRPLWVSVEAALATDGSLRSELFSPEFVAAIDQLNKQAEERQGIAQSEGYELAAGSAPVVPYDCDQSGPSRGQEPADVDATGVGLPVVDLELVHKTVDSPEAGRWEVLETALALVIGAGVVPGDGAGRQGSAAPAPSSSDRYSAARVGSPRSSNSSTAAPIACRIW